MKYLFLFICILISSIVSAQCLNEVERLKIGESEATVSPDFIPYFDCVSPSTVLEKHVCKSKELLRMFEIEAYANKYAQENAFKHDFDHKTLSPKSAKHWNKRFDKSNLHQLCDALKESTSAAYGGGSPYRKIFSNNKRAFYDLKNEHGLMLLEEKGKRKIYMGKDCDVIDSEGKKGTWYKYKRKDEHIILLEDEIIKIDLGYKAINESCLKPENNQLEKTDKLTKTQSKTTQTSITSNNTLASQEEKIAPPTVTKTTMIENPLPAQVEEDKNVGGSLSLSLLVPLLGVLAFKLS